MELIRGPAALSQRHWGSVLTIGTFDGIHLGHQALLERVCRHAAARARPSALLTFEPMPREYLCPADPPARLTSLRERWRILEASGPDALLLLRFGEHLRNMPGAEFARFLATGLQTPLVVVGHDFRFGRNGEASAAVLAELGHTLGFEVEVVPPIMIEGTRVSSSGVRAALAGGDLRLARNWLGRPYSMRGRVIAGERLGRTLGYPTANLRMQRRRSPLTGIFATRVHGIARHALPSVSSLGTRPTVGGTEVLLETHVFDFDADLYGREIEVEFVERLRAEQRFATLEALIEQMHQDAAAARRVLAT